MSKKLLFLTSIIALLAISSAWSAIPVDRDWSNGGGNQLWTNPSNWSGGTVPTSAEKACIRGNFSSTTGPIINSSTTAVANEVVIGDHGSTNDVLTVTGGSLTTSGVNPWIIVGYGTPNNGTINISGGTITIASTLYIGFYPGAQGGGIGNLNMTGGTINVTSAFGIAQGGVSAVGNVLLHGGTITCGSFNMGSSSAAMDITTGTLIINSATTSVSTYVGSGWIKAYGGTGTVNVSVVGSTTTVTATAPATTKAYGPIPANAATGIAENATLSWVAGIGAVSHNVYFGTTTTPVLQGNQTATTFNPGTLAFNTIYYWRIDEVDAGSNVTTGDLWLYG